MLGSNDTFSVVAPTTVNLLTSEPSKYFHRGHTWWVWGIVNTEKKAHMWFRFTSVFLFVFDEARLRTTGQPGNMEQRRLKYDYNV